MTGHKKFQRTLSLMRENGYRHGSHFICYRCDTEIESGACPTCHKIDCIELCVAELHCDSKGEAERTSEHEHKHKPRRKRDAPKSKSSAAFRLEPNPVDGFHDEEFLSGNYEPHRLFPHPHPGTLARHTNGQTIHPVKLSADDIWELLFSDGTNDVDTDEAQEWAERAVKAGVARVDSGEMYADSWVLLDWFSNGAPMDGFSITRSGYQEHGNAAGSPIRFRVIAVYSNGAERELAAVDTIPADAHSDPGVVFQTDDEEFAVFVARRPRETDPATEVVFDRPADHKPDGAPF